MLWERLSRKVDSLWRGLAELNHNLTDKLNYKKSLKHMYSTYVEKWPSGHLLVEMFWKMRTLIFDSTDHEFISGWISIFGFNLTGFHPTSSTFVTGPRKMTAIWKDLISIDYIQGSISSSFKAKICTAVVHQPIDMSG